MAGWITWTVSGGYYGVSVVSMVTFLDGFHPNGWCIFPVCGGRVRRFAVFHFDAHQIQSPCLDDSFIQEDVKENDEESYW